MSTLIKGSKEYIKQYGKKLSYSFDEIKEYLDTKDGNSLIFKLLDGRMTIVELNNEIKEFVKDEQESHERNIKIQENRDYAIQENRISDDPDIR